MRYDAAEERWMPMEIRGIRGYFNELRIDRSTVPEGFHLWELADADNDGFPCRYRKGILVNFTAHLSQKDSSRWMIRNGARAILTLRRNGAGWAERA